MVQRLQWRRVLLAGVVVGAFFMVFAIITQSTFWFLMSGAALMLTGMALFVIGSLQKQQSQQKKARKGPKGKRR